MIILIGPKPTRATYAKSKEYYKVTALVRNNPPGASNSSKDLRFEASANQRLETGAIQSC